MNKPYVGYVNYMLRLYCTHPPRINGIMAEQENPWDPDRLPVFYNKRTEINWKACDEVVRVLPKQEKKMIYALFGTETEETVKMDTLVRQYCEWSGMSPSSAWTILNAVTDKIARKRGLW